MRQAILSISNLSKTFGGVVATDDLSLDVEQGELHAIIGPNGAGKTTLIAQLSGEIFPDNGRILFQEKNITMLPPFKRSHLGIARSFQITSLMQGMDVIDNVALATQANDGHAYKFWKPARDDRDLRQSAIDALKEVGLLVFRVIPLLDRLATPVRATNKPWIEKMKYKMIFHQFQSIPRISLNFSGICYHNLETVF